MSSFSQGDWDVQSSGWFVPIQIGIISLGFGKRKVTSTLHKAYNKAGYGILYANNDGTSSDGIESESVDGTFIDYQNRYRYGDTYDQTLPVPEKEFVGDYDAEREKINFTFAGYDSYDVNATGISGTMTPKIFQNATVLGIGYKGANPNHITNKMGIYYHNTRTTNKVLGTTTANKINFYFDGQFSNSKEINPLTPLSNSATTNNTFSSNLTSSPLIDNVRLRQGNFVEVFTNKQIREGVPGFIDPVGLPKNLRTGSIYKNEGIGGYRITAPDGKTYHFSQPVYHFEMVDRTVLKDISEHNITEKRQYTPFATHWLLTAITGPDYFNTSGGTRSYPSTGDYGYWIRLDHGKWSDGYAWRNPADKKLKNYSSTIESKINKDDFGHYQFGRKQLYYLDKIVSSTHTAYFVKNLRFDAAGSDLTYTAQNINMSNDGTNGGTVSIGENFSYRRQLQLRLDKIVLVKNEDATVNQGQASDPLKLNTFGLNDYTKTHNLNFLQWRGFSNEYNAGNGSNPFIVNMNQEHNVIDVKDFDNFDYNKAVKVIELEYNYNLAVKNHTNDLSQPNSLLSKGSASSVYHISENPNKGKLCLKAVRFKGRNNYDYMPPYKFDYKGEYLGQTTPYVEYPANPLAQRMEWNIAGGFQAISTEYNSIKAKDEWGYLKLDPTAWTMTKISTPTGASINFEHEEDDFYTEAFSRMYWMDKLMFKATLIGSTIQFEVKFEPETQSDQTQNFTKYFSMGEEVFLDLWMARAEGGTNDSDSGRIDVNTNNNSIITYVDATKLIITTNRIVSSNCVQQDMYWNCTLAGDNQSLILNNFFGKNYTSSNSNLPKVYPRGTVPPVGSGIGGNPDHWTVTYKLLANKVPADETGGGLRVKSVVLKDENNNSYKTNYYYNQPGTNKLKNVGNYKSSGITSYSPVRGQKFVPYQSELPSPGVMYEYVSMVAEGAEARTLGETRYRFHVLRPVKDIFDENISMKDDQGREIFKANVIEHNTSNGYFNQSKKIKAKTIDIKVNTSLIGQFRSVEEFNALGQLMSKTEKHYLTGEELYAPNVEEIHRGKVKESFQSMKSIFDTNADGNNPVLRERQLSISSKTDYQSVLRSISTTTAHGIQTETYKDTDPNTGTFNTIESVMANYTMKRIQKVPAYTKYSGMGSKVDNFSNKNMLSQEAMSITSFNKNNVWKTINASISTWKDSWSYRNELTGSDVVENTSKVWRKHKNFVWKEALDADGAYLTTLSPSSPQNYFNWSTGTPLSGSNWKMASEVTRYTRFSMPLEGKDINGNFVSSKMADNNTKTLLSGNARYTEMYYSGAEHINQDNRFDGEVMGAFFRSNERAHTGKYSVKAYTVNDKVFEVTGNSGSANYYTSTTAYPQSFRPGKYKVSFWAYKSYYLNSGGNQTMALPAPSNQNHGQLFFNGNEIPVSETIGAGCWQQLNFYIDILPNTTNSISVRSRQITGNDYFDDFRMHPVASSITSYVYDKDTDNLSYILDGNNMAAAFKYDMAGRLMANYTEIMDTPQLTGGFKINSQYKQSYKNQVLPSDAALGSTINNCDISQGQLLSASLKNDCIGTFQSKFSTQVTGGSGNYKFEYKWLTDVQGNEFTNYAVGTSSQLVPYAAKFCNGDQFDKVWTLAVKVTDNVTGQVAEDNYTYETAICNFSLTRNWASISLSNCWKFCIPKKTLILHHLNAGITENLNYEISYFNKDSNSFDSWIDLTADAGVFCPQKMQVIDESSPSGYRDFVYVAFRIVNQATGETSPINTMTLYGDALLPDEPITDLYDVFPDDRNYVQPGMAIYKDADGRIINVVDTERPIN